jgi:hypothetical protein
MTITLSPEAAELLREAKEQGGRIHLLSTGDVDTTAPLDQTPAVQKMRRSALLELVAAGAVRHVDGVLYVVNE